MDRQISAIALFGVSIVLAFICAGESRCQTDDAKKKAKKVLDDIQVVDGLHTIGTINSQIHVSTPAIEKIVMAGPDMIDTLVLVMQNESISFDAFTRCYSACDQILGKLDRDTRVRWYGGCTTKKVDGVTRIFPGGQMDVNKFRKEVVQDIVEKAASVRKKKQP